MIKPPYALEIQNMNIPPFCCCERTCDKTITHHVAITINCMELEIGLCKDCAEKWNRNIACHVALHNHIASKQHNTP